MNQLSNFCNGPCKTPTGPSIFDYSHDLPYNPGNDVIETGSVPLNCTHYGNLTEANVHVFHALLQTYATNQFLKSKNKRPFILSRSSTLGTSKFAMHWTGDGDAQWIFLKGSISDMFNNQMFGFQMLGQIFVDSVEKLQLNSVQDGINQDHCIPLQGAIIFLDLKINSHTLQGLSYLKPQRKRLNCDTLF